MEPTPAELERIQRICMARAKYYRATVSNFRHISEDDLCQEAMIRALQAHAAYRPPHSYSSFISRAANAGIISAVRHVTGVGKPRPQTLAVGDDISSFVDSVECSELSETNETFAKAAIVIGRAVIPHEAIHGQRYEPAQLAAMGAMRLDRRWSYRVMVLVLDTPPMRAALELEELPHFDTVRYYHASHRKVVKMILTRTREFFG